MWSAFSARNIGGQFDVNRGHLRSKLGRLLDKHKTYVDHRFTAISLLFQKFTLAYGENFCHELTMLGSIRM